MDEDKMQKPEQHEEPRKESKRRKWIKDNSQPFTALACDVLSVVSYFLGMLTIGIGGGVLALLAIVFWLFTVSLPVVAVICGICALFKWKNYGKSGIIISVAAIILPLIIIPVFIFYGVGVAIVIWM